MGHAAVEAGPDPMSCYCSLGGPHAGHPAADRCSSVQEEEEVAAQHQSQQPQVGGEPCQEHEEGGTHPVDHSHSAAVQTDFHARHQVHSGCPVLVDQGVLLHSFVHPGWIFLEGLQCRCVRGLVVVVEPLVAASTCEYVRSGGIRSSHLVMLAKHTK